MGFVSALREVMPDGRVFMVLVTTNENMHLNYLFTVFPEQPSIAIGDSDGQLAALSTMALWFLEETVLSSFSTLAALLAI